MFDIPILFVVFNRYETTLRVFQVIRQQEPSRLFIAADGPRLNRSDDLEKCNQVRQIVDLVDWDCEVITLFRDANLGCRDAVSSAINWFFSHVDKGIILEDDCLPVPFFFSFCQEMLEYYQSDDRVMMVSGDNFQNGIQRGKGSYYFSKCCHIWGWATWKRAWDKYDVEMKSFPDFRKQNLVNSILSKNDERTYWIKCFEKSLIY